jgi:hypothetical protein
MHPYALVCNPAQNRIYVANYWSNSVSIIRDSVFVGIQERAPLTGRRLSLAAYPNPFRGQVHLQFMVSGDTTPNRSGSGHVPGRVRIYDVNGALVRALNPSRPRRAGTGACPYDLIWDGTDGMGRRLPAGVYVVRLTDGAGSVRRKVLLLR